MRTDVRRAVPEPPVEACGPKNKTPPQDLRRTVEAIFWRRRNGAKRRSAPCELGPWRRAARSFVRRARLGVWDRLLSLVREQGGKLGTAFLDGASLRAHRKAAGAARKGDLRRGGTSVRRLAALAAFMGRKACVTADGAGRAVAFRIAPGRAHEPPHAVPLPAGPPAAPRRVVAERGCASHAFGQPIRDMGARPAIPPRRREAPVACPDRIWNNRNKVERLWARLKERRALAARHEKTAASLLGILRRAAALDRPKP